MIPGSFAYHRPTSIDDAVALLTQLGEDALAIAGGHSLIPMMKLRLATPDHLIDLAGVAELKGMRADGADVVIGAMTTQYEVAASDLLAQKFRSCARPLCLSLIRKCATSARSEEMSPTAIPATICRP